mmetsp:Transcript_3999/g.9812  ORF Transcript_3999/g.9812 Transcript_3999/m.9812 type:complete len:147 (+) Transcript_3999:3-443(+)
MRSLQAVLSEAGLWSSGSSQHVRGSCRPCHYVRSQRGCSKGVECDFCHFPHTGKIRRQLGMSSRLYCKHFAEVLNLTYGARPEQLKRVFDISATGSMYLESLRQSAVDESQLASTSQRGREEDTAGSSTLAFIMRDHYRPEGWWSF